MRKLFVYMFLAVGLMIGGADSFAADENEPKTNETKLQAEQTKENYTGKMEGKYGVNVDKIFDHTDEYIGERVTVNGKVDKVYGPKVLTINGEGFLWDNELLVVGAEPFSVSEPFSVPAETEDDFPIEDDFVQVMGTVQKFNKAKIEQEVGLDLNPSIEAKFDEHDLMVVADSLKMIYGMQKGKVYGATDPDISVPVSEIVDKRDEFLGEWVTVRAEVEDVYGPRAFVVGGEQILLGNELLVAITKPLSDVWDNQNYKILSEDDIVEVTGIVSTVKKADIEQKIGRDLVPEFETPFREKPVLIAESIKIISDDEDK